MNYKDYRFMKSNGDDEMNDSKLEVLCRELHKEAEVITPEDDYSRIPKYKHTRRVLFKEVELGGKKHTVVSCTCNHFISRRCLCRHIYSIIDVPPKTEHFYPDCLKLYEVEYGEVGSELFSSKVDVITNMYDSHGGLVFKKSLDDMTSLFAKSRECVDIEFYNARLDRICDVNPLNSNEVASMSFTLSSALNDHRVSSKKMKTNPYSIHLKDYSMMTSLVTCEKGNNYVQELLYKGIQDLLAIQANKTNGCNASMTSPRLASFPNMETQKKIARLKPMGLPTKYHK